MIEDRPNLRRLLQMILPRRHRHEPQQANDQEQWAEPTEPTVEQMLRPSLAGEDEKPADQHAKREFLDKPSMKAWRWIAVHQENRSIKQGTRQMERSGRVHAYVNTHVATEEAPPNQPAQC